MGYYSVFWVVMTILSIPSKFKLSKNFAEFRKTFPFIPFFSCEKKGKP